MENNLIKLGIFSTSLDETRYHRRDTYYSVIKLIELSKKYEIFDLPIKGIDIGVKVWGDIDIKGFIYHFDRVNKSDEKFPIILDDEGYICDGWHRLIKAIINGKDTIKAIRLEIMPEALPID